MFRLIFRLLVWGINTIGVYLFEGWIRCFFIVISIVSLFYLASAYADLQERRRDR